MRRARPGYDFGTGVEELSYAAQSFGYEGSVPFHGWGMEDLRGELAEGRSVVVSLRVDPSLSLSPPWQSGQGTGGEHEPGHMVTVTGVSADGEHPSGRLARWVYYNDPTLGKQVVSRGEFERMWGSQGNSGVAVRREAPAGAGEAGAAPWVALAAGLMAAVSGAGLGGLREGVGGALMGSSGASGKKKRAKNWDDDGGTMSLKKAHKRARRKKRRAKRKRRKRQKRNRGCGRRGSGAVKVDAKADGQEEDPPPPEEEPLERILDQIRNPAFLWSTLTDVETWKMVEKVQGLPDLTIALPMFRGVGYDEIAGPLLRTIAVDEGIQKGSRVLGRLVGDIGFLPAFAVGYGLTVVPEQIEDAQNNAPPAEHAADLIIDGTGFVLSEGAGFGAGAWSALASGPAGYGVKLGADLLTGLFWDWMIEATDSRDGLEGLIERSAEKIQESLSEPRDPRIKPVPTPDQDPTPTGTPGPPHTLNQGLPNAIRDAEQRMMKEDWAYGKPEPSAVPNPEPPG